MPRDLIGLMLGKEKHKFINKPSDIWRLPETTVGIEVELEKVGIRTMPGTLPPELQQYWAWHEDQSLHDNGVEFTFKIPMFGRDVELATKGLLDYAKMNTKWTPSLRTGLHVHVDARDLMRSQLLGLIVYYLMFEPAIYAWVGHDRVANNFCVPWYKSSKSIDEATQVLTYMRRYAEGRAQREDVLLVCQEFHRYAGLNLKCLADLGSVEFRHLPCTLEWERVKTWINIIFSLKKAALEAPESSFTIINDLYRRGIPQKLQDVFGADVAREMERNNPRVYDEILAFGVPNASDLILEVLYDEDPEETGLYWATGAKPKETPNHPSLEIWRKAQFPKGYEAIQEKKPAKKLKNQFEVMANRIDEAILRDFQLPRAVEVNVNFAGQGPPDPPPVLEGQEARMFAPAPVAGVRERLLRFQMRALDAPVALEAPELRDFYRDFENDNDVPELPEP